jgi:hypothetical protein
VIQLGETIIFGVDHAANTVDAIINIRYTGSAQQFAWILPLQRAPEKLDVADRRVFAVMDEVSAPRFRMTVERRGVCADRDFADMLTVSARSAGGSEARPRR